VDGAVVPIRYQKDNPTDAKVNTSLSIWGDTIVYALFPFLIVLVLYVMPDRFDPIIPQKAKILIGIKPLFKIIQA
jgi:hypothetical protein